MVSAYMGGTRGSGVLASAGDVLEMNVVRGVGGVCEVFYFLDFVSDAVYFNFKYDNILSFS